MKKVSLIVPAYNAEKYLVQCLSSILDQAYPNMEVIIVNDGSVDSTESIAKKFIQRDKRFRYFLLKDNVGVNRARAFALHESTGDYIGFVDADDWIDINMVSRMVRRIEIDQSDIAICGVAYPDGHGHFLRNNLKFKNNYHIKDGLVQFSRMRLGSGYLVNKLYQRRVIYDSATYECPEKIVSGEDYIINIGAFHKARSISLLPEVFYYYRQHSNSVTQTVSRGEAFARQLRAYSLCLQRYGQLESDFLDYIDCLYQIQFRFDCYKVDNIKELASFRKHIEESIMGIISIRPESIYPLLHTFDMSFNDAVKQTIGQKIQYILKAIGNRVLVNLHFGNSGYIDRQ